MLNFEDNMRAANTGYVVLSLEEYNRLRDEAAAAKAVMAELIKVSKQSWTDEYVVEPNNAAFYAFAKKKFEELFGDEQHNYEVRPISDFYMGYTALATRRTEPASDGDDADDILNSDD
jgi:hypothetical protein